MHPLAFYAIAAVILVAAAATTFLKDLKLAAMALLASLAGMAVLFVLLKAGLLAALQLVLVAGGAAGLFHLAYWRTDEARASEPSEERRYWAGLVSVLGFVLFFRVIAGSDWGAQDVSQLVANGFGPLFWPAMAALVLAGLVGAIAVATKEQA